MNCLLFSRLVIFFIFIFSSIMCIFSAEESFILINGTTDEVVLELGPYINERATPASSFKIVLSLIGYDAGILKDENTPTWDFQMGYDDFSSSWTASQTPQSWMARSCIWYSKILALQLGLTTIQNYLALLEYGNQDMSGGLAQPGPVNPAWVSSSLKISPREQVDFIQKMIRGNLSVSAYAVQMTKVLVFKEILPGGWGLYGKAGLGGIFKENGDNLEVRWFVGWIEKDQLFFPFAYQLRDIDIDITQTVPRVKQLLDLFVK